ncbi:MAG: TetR/AcrR family transcriptional regulator [Xanthobacteraceae bacterium]|nr:TetR/AcrR family transcriptional regulator [Xanthobacteraceae bacterium]
MELVDIAEQMFLERGFADTSMQMIAERAGASKETLYRHFSSKELLFVEIVTRNALLVSGPDAAVARDGSPESVLSELGIGVLRIVLAANASRLFRTVVSESARTPELGDLFYQRGPAVVAARLTDYLARAAKRGELRCEDPQTAARLFLGAVMSNYHVRRLVQSDWKPPSEKEVRRHVEAAVSMFLAQYESRRPAGRKRLACRRQSLPAW